MFDFVMKMKLLAKFCAQYFSLVTLFALFIADMSAKVINDAAGFRVSNGTFNGLVQRYSYKDGKIHFDDFIHCVVRMKTMFGKPHAAMVLPRGGFVTAGRIYSTI